MEQALDYDEEISADAFKYCLYLTRPEQKWQVAAQFTHVRVVLTQLEDRRKP